MSAPKKIWIIANGSGDVGMFDDESHQKQLLESVQSHNGDYDGPYSMEPYVHASELEAVQARLDDALRRLSRYESGHGHDTERSPIPGKLYGPGSQFGPSVSAIAAAKGE